MAIGVGLPRRHADKSTMLVGKTVESRELWPITDNFHHVVGRGKLLVPTHTPGSAVLNASDTAHLIAYWIVPRFQQNSQMWVFDILGLGNVSISITNGTDTGPTRNFQLSNDKRFSKVLYEFDRSSHSSTPVGHTVTITPASSVSSSTAWIGTCVWEMPRATISEDTNDRGTEGSRLQSGQPIGRNTLSNMLNGIGSAPEEYGDRVYFHWAAPYSINGSTDTTYATSVTGTTFTDLFPTTIPILARKIAPSDTTATIKCRLFGWVTAGNAEVTIDSTGDTGSINFSNTTPAWSDEVTLTVDCTDMSKVDGLQGSSVWDELSIQGGNDNVANTLHVTSFAIYE